MRTFLWIAGIVLCALNACNYDDGACWIDGEGNGDVGAGGGPIVPGGGGYGDVPPKPQGATDPPVPDCNIVADSLCNQKCLADYEAAAAECGKITDDGQRKTCQDNAYTAYTNCRQSCQQAADCRKDCEDKADACEAECRKLPEDDKAARRKCWEACNNAYADCIKKCKD